jgi:hypothetical protein
VPISSTTGVDASSILDIPEPDLGLRCRPGNAAATVKTAMFPRRLLLFYIVYNGGKSRTARAQPRPQPSLSWKKGKTVMKAMMSGIGLLFAASLCVAAQDQRDSAANRSKIMAF